MRQPSAYATLVPVVFLLLVASQAVGEEPATECRDAAEARKLGWEVIAGDAPKGGEPLLSVVNDATVGKTAVRVDVRQPGAWQGLTLDQTVDLTRFARMEFWIKQNVHSAGEAWTCALQVFFADGGTGLATPLMGLGEQWTHVSLPLRTPPWTLDGRPQTFGTASRFRFYPFRELDSPGEYLQIDGLTFIPREDDPTMATQGLTYAYEPAPEGGADAGRTVLLNGQNASEEQISFAPYSGDPKLTFDLGETQTLTRVTVKAFPRSGRNIASLNLSVSEDGKAWTAAGSLANEKTPAAGSEQVLSLNCLGVGRYVRLELRKPQVDVPLTLGEVVLDRRVTTAADREFKPTAYFEGPTLPPLPASHADNADYVWLRGQRLQMALQRRTGIIAGAWTADGTQVILRGWDRYVFENRDALTESAETADRGAMAGPGGWEGTNADLPGLKLTKQYRLRSNAREEWLEKTTRFVYTGPRADQFVTLLSNVALTEAFRRGGTYEGVQVRCDRISADDVHFKRVTPPNKSVMLSHPDTGATVTQYRIKVNDRYVAPYYTQVAAEVYNTTSYNRCGWEIGHATLRLAPGQAQSVQVNTAILGDGRFGWERHFVALPDVQAYSADLQRPAWTGEVKAVFSDSYDELLWGMVERTARRLSRIFDDGILLSPGYGYCDGWWGDLPTAGDCHDFFGGVTPSDEVARIMRDVQRNPRFRAGLYMWLQSVMPESQVARDHPDWFIATNKLGEPLSFFPTLKTNFSRILNAPGHQDFLVQQVMQLHERYPQADWYLDGGCASANAIDWKTLRISQDYEGQDFCRRVRQAFRRSNSQGMVFFNEAEDRVADIGYAEIGTGFGQDWRTTAAGMYQAKVRQYFDPQRLLCPLYITRANALPYLRLCVGLGLPPAEAVSYETRDLLQYAPFCSAAFETRALQFSPTALAPDWRADADTPVETYALRAGRALVLSVVSHAEGDIAQELRAQVPADVARPGETVVVAHHVLKDLMQFPSPVTDFAAKAAYRETGWAAGAVTEWRTLTPLQVGPDGWITLKATLPPGLLNLFSVTREPVYYWSRDGLRANFLLPAVRSHALSASRRAGTLTISVGPETVPVEVLALAPAGQCVAGVSAGGKPVAWRAVKLHGLHGAIIPSAPAAQASAIAVSFKPENAAARTPELTAPATVTAGSELTATLGATGPLPYSVWREGTLVATGMTEAGRLRLAVPAVAQDGEYVLRVGHTRATFTVSGHRQPEQIEPYMPPMQPTQDITPLSLQRSGVDLPAQGKGSFAGGRADVDPNALTLRVEMPNETLCYSNRAYAGMEFKGLRAATIRVTHNMVPQQGVYPVRHVLLEESPNAFIGCFVDYATAAGYTKRVALSLGQMNLKRDSKEPQWGAARPPDHFLRLPNTIFTGEQVEGRLDFAAWAPPGWDGRVWVSLVFDNVFRSRWLSLQLTALNPAADVPAAPVEDVTATMNAPRDRTLRAARFAEAPKLDGTLDEPVWTQGDAASGFFIVEKQGQKASQETDVRVGHDDRFVYLGFTCRETEKKSFTVNGGAAGTPWWDDSIEFALAPAAWHGKFLHVIATADAVTYQETSMPGHTQAQTSTVPLVCAARKYPDRFTVEVAVPLGAGGLPAPPPGERWQAQFMRTRVAPAGTREFTTWTMSEGYHDFAAFGGLVFD